MRREKGVECLKYRAFCLRQISYKLLVNNGFPPFRLKTNLSFTTSQKFNSMGDELTTYQTSRRSLLGLEFENRKIMHLSSLSLSLCFSLSRFTHFKKLKKEGFNSLLGQDMGLQEMSF